jgi:hypothetical protein
MLTSLETPIKNNLLYENLQGQLTPANQLTSVDPH